MFRWFRHWRLKKRIGNICDDIVFKIPKDERRNKIADLAKGIYNKNLKAEEPEIKQEFLVGDWDETSSHWKMLQHSPRKGEEITVKNFISVHPSGKPYHHSHLGENPLTVSNLSGFTRDVVERDNWQHLDSQKYFPRDIESTILVDQILLLLNEGLCKVDPDAYSEHCKQLTRYFSPYPILRGGKLYNFNFEIASKDSHQIKDELMPRLTELKLSLREYENINFEFCKSIFIGVCFVGFFLLYVTFCLPFQIIHLIFSDDRKIN